MLKDQEIKKLKPTGKDYQKADYEGLVLLVRAQGTKTWRYEFRLDGKKQKYAYGNYPEFSLEDARTLHRTARKLVEVGKHPSTVLDSDTAKKMLIDGASTREVEIEIAKQEAKTITFGELAALYRADWVEQNWKNPDKAWSPVNRHLLPKLADKPLSDIDVVLFREMVYSIRERVGIPTARICRDWTKRIFDYGVEHDFCQHNPANLIKPGRVGKWVRRERWLKTPEIKRYLTVLYQANCYRGHKLALHLLLMTGLRISELCETAWADINIDKTELLIDGKRMKGRKDHLVLLPTQALEMLQELKLLAGGSPWVFPSDRNPLKHSGPGTLRYNHQEICATAGLEDYKPHDHRHTASTHLREQGHSPEIVETALAHAIPGVAGIYSHAQYRDQRLAMLQSWANFLDSVMTEQVVIQGTFRKLSVSNG